MSPAYVKNHSTILLRSINEPMNLLKLNQSLLLQFSEADQNTELEITTLPVNIGVNIMAVLKDGFKMLYGPTTLGKFKLSSVETRLLGCQKTLRKNSPLYEIVCSDDESI